ncbi:MAG: 2,3-bisphosphoglycerate-independent phosphoglycerate mutase [Candidatus Eisenbacteria bacterium]|nr:2,3-bisphosphoglycerate-independent phosphoglycerate mutase [Candidatus Latescibacterota bacterium]MBD3302222.1 2,3-bisphosphoglycerate-independent phosphoglycerate mutase [Candidatus Eisenbacteria bacterium]
MDWTLKRSDRFPPPEGPVVFVVLDGVGLGPGDEGDAVARAWTPVLDRLREEHPWRALKAHGVAVGLPSDDDMGNSEVGHNAIGAGRVIDQGAKRVNLALKDGSLFEGETWNELAKRCLDGGGTFHLIGLLSDGNVHSHIDHLFALIREADRIGIETLRVHPLLDGRDVPETSALDYVEPLESLLAEIDDKKDRSYRIASGGGRMITTMDRYEADWRIVERGYNAHVHGDARTFSSAQEAIETYRDEEPGITDQNLPPFVITDESGDPVGPIRDGDSVVFFNFRGDRAIEISRAFEQESFPHFDRGDRPDTVFAGMMQYDDDEKIPKRFLVPPPTIERTIGEYLARNAIGQLACSETQKYGHVTYFWNGNRSGMFDVEHERYIEIPSNEPPFEDRPWMKAAEITDRVILELRKGTYRFVRLNYANGDMVGHTGKLPAVVYAVEAVDLSLGRLARAVSEMNGILVVTADHGNADEMYEHDKTGGIKTDEKTGRPKIRPSHSLNPVPFIIAGPKGRDPVSLRDDLPEAGLPNIAATLFQLLGYEPPEGFEESLLR